MNFSEENEIVIKSLITRIQMMEHEIFELNLVREEYNDYYEKTKDSHLAPSDLDYIIDLLEHRYEEKLKDSGKNGQFNKQLQNKINKIRKGMI